MLEQDERIRVIFETPEVLELILENVTEEDSGEYKVIANNCMGESESVGNIKVVSKLK